MLALTQVAPGATSPAGYKRKTRTRCSSQRLPISMSARCRCLVPFLKKKKKRSRHHLSCSPSSHRDFRSSRCYLCHHVASRGCAQRIVVFLSSICHSHRVVFRESSSTVFPSAVLHPFVEVPRNLVYVTFTHLCCTLSCASLFHPNSLQFFKMRGRFHFLNSRVFACDGRNNSVPFAW